MSLCKPRLVFAASQRQYTAAVGHFQIPRVGIYEWREVERGDWYTDWQN